MKPVIQTDTSLETSNCFEACVASILEIKMSDVLNQKLCDFLERINSFCFDYKTDTGYIPKNHFKIFFKNYWVIASGPSPKGSEKYHRHSVVWKNKKIVHDPHPDKIGIKSIDTYSVIYHFANHFNKEERKNMRRRLIFRNETQVDKRKRKKIFGFL